MRRVYVDGRFGFASVFDDESGAYIRTGILDERGNDTGADPFMASFPQLIDVGVMGHCKHGKSGLMFVLTGAKLRKRIDIRGKIRFLYHEMSAA